ncbi:MAG: phage baseplate assembly protein V [Dysgonomonas sp.]|nr:phage baseplate assembly protein V [Dysgonomonas sp.]
MITADLLDEKHITNAFVYVEGEQLNIVSLYLNQSFGQHHKFKVVMDYDITRKSFMGNPIEHFELIGKIIDIDLQQGNDSGGAYEFRGIIEDVQMEGREGKHGYLILEGSSLTSLLERGARLDIFTDMNLQQIFEEVTDGVKSNSLSKVNKPVYNVPVNFLMQYNESDWEFLQRLSAISGETLLYTGRDLVFGKYSDWEAIEVTYDKELTHIQFGSRLLNNTFKNYQYIPTKDDTLEKESPERIENTNQYIDLAGEKAKELVRNRPVVVPASMEVEDQGALIDIVERRKINTAAKSVYIKGIAKTCAPRIGRLLTIVMPGNMSEANNLGTYRVIKVTHTIDENHRYHCEFEAIPAELQFFPTPELKMPIANSLLGVVTSNTDPEGQGRVRVEFPFAKDRVSATWMRVMSPDAGGLVGYSSNKTGVVEKNRGMIFIPEEGDQVMIGFEFGDPNRPYVMGSMFHGMNTVGGGANNHIKSIITRSGHTLEFDDADESLGITIKDRNGNFIHINSKDNNIEITALETIIMKATDIRMEASNNIEMQAEASIKADAMADIHIGAQDNIDIATESNILMKSMGDTSIDAKSKIEISGQSTKVTSASDIEMSGMDTVVKGQTTKVSGASHKIEIV